MFFDRIAFGFCLFSIVSSNFPSAWAAESINITRLLQEVLQEPAYRGRGRNNVEKTLRDSSYLPETDYFEDFQVDETGEMVDSNSRLERVDRNLLPEYRNLCEIVTRKMQMSDEEYEYQPPHHYEVFCKSYSFFDQGQKDSVKPARQRCAHPGFHCVQRSRTLFMVRRRWESDCWEPFTKEIPSGCDCMWPVSSLGEITPHY